MNEAERVVRAYSPAQGLRIREQFTAGEVRFESAREAASPVATGILLREAAGSYARARAAARDAEVDDAALAAVDVGEALAEVSATRGGEDALSSDAIAFLSSRDGAEATRLDRMDGESAEAMSQALDTAVAALRSDVEARTVAHLQVTRGLKIALAAVVVLALGYGVARSLYASPNVALGKPVTASSRWAGTPAGQEVVDGNTGGTFGIHTQTEENPWVAIDLGGNYALYEARIYNRGDGWFDDALPMAFEVSDDGATYQEIERRTTSFSQSAPWILKLPNRRARFVRVRIPRKSQVALSEIEVFGRR